MRDKIKQIVSNMVATFKNSKRAQLWYVFTDDMRDALIDACVMDQVRTAVAWRNESAAAAWRNDGAHPFTVEELLDIRRAFVRALHEGIPRRGSPPLRYVLEGNENGGPL